MEQAAKKRDFYLFCVAGAFLGIYTGLYDPIFNNYLSDVFKISESARGGLEFFRELPGFLVVFFSGMLVFLADTRIAMISLTVMSLGLWGQGFMSPGLPWAVVWMMMWSTGSHLFMPVSNSIVVGLSNPGEVGRRLGKWSGINTAASLVGYLVVWAGFRYLGLDYRWTFGAAGLVGLAAALCLLGLRTTKTVRRQGPAIFFKKKYSLYYLLSVLFGARKQIFLTFGPWVLIKIFHQPVATFAMLGLIGTGLGIFFKPALGAAIDKVGERAVIMAESLTLVAICVGYGYADLFPPAVALVVAYACFVGDNLLFACLMARATYLNKIVDDRADLTPTLSMGVTVDHAVSMTIPFFAGLLWESMGYRYVFLVAAALAVINFIAATFIPAGGSACQKPTEA
jgi:MFS family permease